MRIRYVVSTMVFWWRENHLSMEQECQYLQSLGFGVELWPTIRGENDCRYQRRNWNRLMAATEGMLVSMRSRTDKPNLEQWAEQIECAKRLNAHIVADLPSLGIPVNQQLNGNQLTGEVIQLANDHAVTICVETGNLDVIRELGEHYPTLAYCLDTGFANIDPDHDFTEYVDELAPRVRHLHLTDNYGHIDDHEPPGLQGGISAENWDYLLKALRQYDHEIVGSLEMYPCMPGVMIRKAMEFLFDQLDWPNRPNKPADYASLNYPGC